MVLLLSGPACTWGHPLLRGSTKTCSHCHLQGATSTHGTALAWGSISCIMHIALEQEQVACSMKSNQEYCLLCACTAVFPKDSAVLPTSRQACTNRTIHGLHCCKLAAESTPNATATHAARAQLSRLTLTFKQLLLQDQPALQHVGGKAQCCVRTRQQK